MNCDLSAFECNINNWAIVNRVKVRIREEEVIVRVSVGKCGWATHGDYKDCRVPVYKCKKKGEGK